LASDHGNVPAPASPAHAVVPLELPDVLPLLDVPPLDVVLPPELVLPDPPLEPDPEPDPPLLEPEEPELPEVPPELPPLELPPLDPLADPLPLPPLDELLPDPLVEPVPASPLLLELSPQPIAVATMTREEQPSQPSQRCKVMRTHLHGRLTRPPQTFPAFFRPTHPPCGQVV
jgi:protein TonB